MNQITKNPDLNIFNAGLNMDDKERAVYDYSGGYNFFPMMAELMKQTPTKISMTANERARERIKGWYGVYYKPVIFNDALVGQVLTTALGNNGTLVVTLTDSTLDIFRQNDTIMDGKYNMGTVVTSTAGSFTLQPAPAASGMLITFDTTTMFQPNDYVTVIGGHSGIGNSLPRTSLMQTPNFIKYQTYVHRDNLSIQTFLDTGETYVEGIAGTNLWFYNYQMQMKARIARQKDASAFFVAQGQNTNSLIPGGQINYSRGWRNSVMANDGSGGIYRPNSGPMTLGIITEAAQAQKQRKAKSGNTNLQWGMGTGALSQLQAFSAPYIQFGGTQNTFGGKDVEGINVFTMSVGGVHIEFMEVPFLNDVFSYPTLSTTNPNFTRLSNTIMGFNVDGGFNAYGSGGRLPSIERVFYGPVAERLYWVPGVYGGEAVAGLTAEGLSDVMSMLTSSGMAVNETPTDSIGYISNDAYTFMTWDNLLYEQL